MLLGICKHRVCTEENMDNPHQWRRFQNIHGKEVGFCLLTQTLWILGIHKLLISLMNLWCIGLGERERETSSKESPKSLDLQLISACIYVCLYVCVSVGHMYMCLSRELLIQCLHVHRKEISSIYRSYITLTLVADEISPLEERVGGEHSASSIYAASGDSNWI